MATPDAHGYSLGTIGSNIAVRGSTTIMHAVLTLPGAIQRQGWVEVPASREHLMAIEAFAAPNTVSETYLHLRQQHIGGVVASASQVASLRRFLDELRRPLHPHQIEFCAFAYSRRSAYNASEQGTGKTATAWVLARAWKAQRVLILTNRSLFSEWRYDLNQLYDNHSPFTVIALDDSVATRAAEIRRLSRTVIGMAPIALLVNYETLARLFDELANWRPDLIVFDEAYKIKTPRTKVTRSALRLIKVTDARVLLLSGTPLGNHVGDLWAQLVALNPSFANHFSYSDFIQRFARFARLKIGPNVILKPIGCLDPAGLVRIIQPYWYRVLKATCLELPPVQRRTVVVDLPPSTRKLYEAVKRDGISALGAQAPLDDCRVKLIRLQQLTGGHRPLLDNCVYVDETELEELPCPKLNWLLQWAIDVLQGNPEVRAIIWFRFNAELRRVERELARLLGSNRVVGIVGGNPPPHRLAELKERFNARDMDGPQVLCAQVQALSAGHNLQAADYHVWFSHTWSYLDHKQAEDRSHRQGRVGMVTYIDLVARHTVDEEITRALARKEDLSVRLAIETGGIMPDCLQELIR
jgi:SNF2 family DNA or RNA helicase